MKKGKTHRKTIKVIIEKNNNKDIKNNLFQLKKKFQQSEKNENERMKNRTYYDNNLNN